MTRWRGDNKSYVKKPDIVGYDKKSGGIHLTFTNLSLNLNLFL